MTIVNKTHLIQHLNENYRLNYFQLRLGLSSAPTGSFAGWRQSNHENGPFERV